MKNYLVISNLAFILIVVWCGFGLFDIQTWKSLLDTENQFFVTMWAGCGFYGFMAVYGFGLLWNWRHRTSKTEKDRKELSDLIMILKEGREEQLAVINILRSNVIQERISTSEK